MTKKSNTTTTKFAILIEVLLEQRWNPWRNEKRRPLTADLAFQQRKTAEKERNFHLLEPPVFSISDLSDTLIYSRWDWAATISCDREWGWSVFIRLKTPRIPNILS